MIFQTLCEIVTVVSVLIKFGRDDILDDKALFIAFLNELGITINGKKINSENLYEMTQDITNRQKEELIEEFLRGHEPIYRKLAMLTNSVKFD